jgi:hypothetical protein
LTKARVYRGCGLGNHHAFAFEILIGLGGSNDIDKSSSYKCVVRY